jgi:hypothetical protein
MTLFHWFYLAAGSLAVAELVKYFFVIRDGNYRFLFSAVPQTIGFGALLYYGWQLQAYDDLIVQGMMQQGQHFMNILMQLGQMLAQKGLL